jgi:dolichol kinase
LQLVDQWRANLVRETRRKLIHLSGLSVPVGILVLGRIYTAIVIALVLALALILEAGRLKGMICLPEVREQEQEKVAGYIYYIVGSLLAVLLFLPMIALTSMLMLTLGDAVSGLVGSVLEDSNVRAQGSKRVKPLPIVTAMFLACLAIGYLSSGLTRLPFEVYLAGAIGATVADSVALVVCNRGLDDNLAIPLFAGIMMSLAFWAG